MNDFNYFDHVYGGWLGKCLGGAAGAPVEGVKKLIDRDFREMIRPDLPNDDLDMQLLWLEVLEEKGLSLTANDLAKAWDEHCWYPFSEYGIFLKNYERGIMPPYSGSFNNPFFCEGEGCPIRSEIWAMVFPNDPDKAAYYAGLDGSLDHAGESVWIEQYYAAVESRAFTQTDIIGLLKSQLHFLPESSRARGCAALVLSSAEQGIADWQKVRTAVLQKYGHNDFTNSVTNLGLMLIALLYGKDNLQTVIDIAFRSGFDTDCTCATAAAIWGILYGVKKIPEELKALVNDGYVVGIDIKSDCRSIYRLAEQTCRLGETLKNGKRLTQPSCEQRFDKAIPQEIRYSDRPAIGFKDSCRIKLVTQNRSDRAYSLRSRIENVPAGWTVEPEYRDFLLPAGQTAEVEFTIRTPEQVKTIANINKLKAVTAEKERPEQSAELSFGIAGAMDWIGVGPFFENLEKEDLPGIPSAHGEGCVLPTLECMVNNAVYLNKAYIDETDFAAAFSAQEKYIIRGYEDLLPLDQEFGCRGQMCVYLRQEVISPKDQDLWLIIGNNDGFALWINDEKKLCYDEMRLWTPYNHYELVRLKKGKNRIVLKLLRRGEQFRFSLGFRKYDGEHFHKKRWCTDLSVTC